MKLYSDFAGRRLAQILADLAAIAVMVAAVWAAVRLYASIVVLADVGRSMESAGSGFQKTMTDAGTTLGKVPLIGGGIRSPFDQASDAGGQLAQAGRSQQQIVDTSALVIAIASAAVVILLVLYIWLRPRIRFVRRATGAYRVSRLDDGADVLALRALTTARARDLRRIPTGPVDGWRRGDASVVRALAALELRGAGVKVR